MEFLRFASNLDLELEDFLYVENVRTTQIGCTALQQEGLIPLPKHRHLAPPVTSRVYETSSQSQQGKHDNRPTGNPYPYGMASWRYHRRPWGILNGTGCLCWANWIGTQAFQLRNYSFIYFKCSYAYTIYRVTFSSSTPWPHGYKPKFPAFTNAFLAQSHRNLEEWTTATNTQNIETQFRHPELGPATHSAWTRLSLLYLALISFLQIAFWASTMGYQQALQPTLPESVPCDFFIHSLQDQTSWKPVTRLESYTLGSISYKIHNLAFKFVHICPFRYHRSTFLFFFSCILRQMNLCDGVDNKAV